MSRTGHHGTPFSLLLRGHSWIYPISSHLIWMIAHWISLNHCLAYLFRLPKKERPKIEDETWLNALKDGVEEWFRVHEGGKKQPDDARPQPLPEALHEWLG